MSKSKRAPALFELISKPQRGDGLRVRPTPPMTEPSLAPEPTLAAEPREPAPALVFVPEPASHPPAEAAADAGDGRWWRITGGRIRFSLSQRGATIALSVIGLVLIFVHYLGYSLGERRGRESALAAEPVAGAQEIEEARNGPVTRQLFEGVGEDPTAAVSAPPPAIRPAAPVSSGPPAAREAAARTGWVKGNTYIVVQDFGKDARGDAEKAREYLVQNGVPAVVLERSGNYPYRLITAKGFDRDDQGQRRQADEYQERVRRLGQAYLQAGGRYDFKTAYFIKLTGETW